MWEQVGNHLRIAKDLRKSCKRVARQKKRVDQGLLVKKRIAKELLVKKKELLVKKKELQY